MSASHQQLLTDANCAIIANASKTNTNETLSSLSLSTSTTNTSYTWSISSSTSSMSKTSGSSTTSTTGLGAYIIQGLGSVTKSASVTTKSDLSDSTIVDTSSSASLSSINYILTASQRTSQLGLTTSLSQSLSSGLGWANDSSSSLKSNSISSSSSSSSYNANSSWTTPIPTGGSSLAPSGSQSNSSSFITSSGYYVNETITQQPAADASACWSSYASWSSSAVVYEANHTEVWYSTYYTTQATSSYCYASTVHNDNGFTTTLCDGVPRALGSVFYTTSCDYYTSTNVAPATAVVSAHTAPPPSCTISPGQLG